MHHRLDGAAHEDGRVVDDLVVHAFREVAFQLGHACAHRVGDLDGVRPRALEYRNRHRGLVVQQRTQRVLAGAQFDTSDVPQAGDRAVFAGANDDVLEFLFGDQTTLGVDRQLEVCRARCRRRAQRTCGDLAVLFANRVDHVRCGEVARGDLLRVEPDAQGVIAHAEQLHITNAIQPRQLVLDVECGVVGQVEHVIALIRRGQVHHHGQVRGGLVHGHAEALHLGGQGRHGPRDAVLHLHLSVVEISAQSKGNG